MLRQIVFAFIVSSCLVAQTAGSDQATAARSAAGCGDPAVQFAVSADKHQHPAPSPVDGKAIIFVFGESPTYRWGLDGDWIGATENKSYFSFAVDPGDHRVCTQRQSMFKNLTDISAATSLKTEAGHTYYFRIRDFEHKDSKREFQIEVVDPAEGLLLISKVPYGTSHPK